MDAWAGQAYDWVPASPAEPDDLGPVRWVMNSASMAMLRMCRSFEDGPTAGLVGCLVRKLAILAVAVATVAGAFHASSSQAADLQFDAKVATVDRGEQTFTGTLKVEDGLFDEFIGGGNLRLRVSGRVNGDHITVTGQILDLALMAAQVSPGSFKATGTFKDGRFTGEFKAKPSSISWGSSAKDNIVYRGSFSVTDPALQAAAQTQPAPSKSAPPPAPASTTPPAVTPPAEATVQPVTKPVTSGATTTAQTSSVAAVPAAPPPPPEPRLNRSQRSAIQGQLASLGFYAGGIDGSLGPGTRKAIKAFQSANELEPTGYVTDATVQLLAEKVSQHDQQLAREKALAAQQAAAAPATNPPPTAATVAPASSGNVQASVSPTAATVATVETAPPAAAATTTTTTTTEPATTSTAAAIAVPDDLDPVDTMFVAVSSTSVRAQPNVGAAVVRSLMQGEHVYVLGKLAGKPWYLVSDKDKPIGYVIDTWLVAESEYGKSATKTAEAAPSAPAASVPPPAPPAPPPDPQQQAMAEIPFGHYHALVIGNDAYRTLPRLASAARDAAAVADVLKNHYGFEVETLINATREQIIDSLSGLRKRLTADDNLVIYYAGHGVYDEAADRGYWLPIDADRNTPTNWVSNADITDMIKAMQAKHVLIVADSCYSGTLTRGLLVAQTDAGYIRRMAEKRARTALTSGGLEPVVDAGGNAGHSVFAGALIDVLMGNTGVMDGQDLFAQISGPVAVNAPQTPVYGDVRFAGHDGGDFIFVRKD